MSGCRIGKIKLKSGAEIRVFPNDKNNFRRVSYDWGEIVVRCYDNKPITSETVVYMLECAKNDFMHGNCE